MGRGKYDIFISYRHDGGAQYARTLQLMLEKKGYRVFLDYDELRDGKFSPMIEAAIIEAPIYILLLSKGSMARCANEGDWVRREIEIALREGKRLIPVNPDNSFDGIPPEVPDNIRKAVEDTQYSDINFGQMLGATVDQMVNDRIRPHISRPSPKYFIIGVAAVTLVMLGAVVYFSMKKHELRELKEQTEFNGEPIAWSPNVTKDQVLAIREILASMSAIEGGEFLQGAIAGDDGSYDDMVELEFETPAFNTKVGPFAINKYEVTVGQWNAIMQEEREGNSRLPVSFVTFDQAQAFADRLCNLTLLNFCLPTETQWEYAAKGASTPESFIFAGSDDANEAAWYNSNSDGVPHAELRSTPTVSDLFNMSGNVSEWCDTRFRPYDASIPYPDNQAMVVRGGNYGSELYELTVTHREPAARETSIPTLGFRIAIDNNR